MKILTSKRPPSTKKMTEILKQEVSGYTYTLFGIGTEKSIIVQKSAFVGVQISKRENEITVEGSTPSIATSVLSSLLFCDLGLIFQYIFHSGREKLEKEIAVFLNNRFNYFF